MKKGDIARDYQLISNLLCSFVDFMRILAPLVAFQPSILEVKYFQLKKF